MRKAPMTMQKRAERARQLEQTDHATDFLAAELRGAQVLMDVIEERGRQEKKWGEHNHDPFTYLGILMEEVGEYSQATLHNRFGGPEAENMRTEAVQVAAVAVAIIECLDRGKWRWPDASSKVGPSAKES